MALAWGLGVFAVAVVIHLVVWRLLKPIHQYTTLLGLYLAILVATSLMMLAGLVAGDARAWIPATLLDYLTFATLYIALALAYTSTYSAVQADSPSMLLLLMINDSGERGVAGEDLYEQLGDDVLIVPRVDDLVTGGLAVRDGSRYVIEPRGALLASVHIGYRALLKMGKGG